MSHRKQYRRYSFRLPTGHRIFLKLDPQNPLHQPVIQILDLIPDPRLRTWYIWELIARDNQLFCNPKRYEQSVAWQLGARWVGNAVAWTRPDQRDRNPAPQPPADPMRAASMPPPARTVSAQTRDFFERLGIADLLLDQEEGDHDDAP